MWRKSKVIHLRCRFQEPASGEILLAGHPLAAYEVHALRQHIDLALWKNRIFKGAREENIRHELVDANVEQAQQAARRAQIVNAGGAYVLQQGRMVKHGPNRGLNVAEIAETLAQPPQPSPPALVRAVAPYLF